MVQGTSGRRKLRNMLHVQNRCQQKNDKIVPTDSVPLILSFSDCMGDDKQSDASIGMALLAVLCSTNKKHVVTQIFTVEFAAVGDIG